MLFISVTARILEIYRFPFLQGSSKNDMLHRCRFESKSKLKGKTTQATTPAGRFALRLFAARTEIQTAHARSGALPL